MNTTMIAWFLVSLASGGRIDYGPPMATLADCERLQTTATKLWTSNSGCVQLRVYLTK